MHRTPRLPIFLAFLVTGFALAPLGAKEPLNVLFIVSDDLNTDLGCYGHGQVKSPNIDKLAARGVRFDRAYCQFPLCNPSRSSFLTGRKPNSTRVLTNGPRFREAIPDTVTLSQLFQQSGYFAGRVGKLYHYGVPGDIGTDGLDDPPSWNEVRNPKGHDKDVEDEIFTINPKAVGSARFGGTLSWYNDKSGKPQTDTIGADETIKMLEARKDKPFFIAFGLYRPHTPYVAPKEFFDLYPLDSIALPAQPGSLADIPPLALTTKPEQDAMTDNQRREAIQAYRASTSFMDAQAGRVLDALERLKLADRTIVVFTSDHGYHLYDRGMWQKQSLFERSLRVPLIIAAPNAKLKGAVHGAPVELLDVYPTLADLAGLKAPEYLDGKSLRPLLDEAGAKGRAVAHSQVMRGQVPGLSIITERWHYITWAYGEQGEQLYDRVADPYEMVNLAKKPGQEQVLADLRRQVEQRWPKADWAKMPVEAKGKGKKAKQAEAKGAATPSQPATPEKRAKTADQSKGNYKPGVAAFTPSKDTKPFDPAQVKPDFLDPKMFHVPEGLEVTLWASSPMLFNPANMDIDHMGRIWVNEGVNYRRHSGRHRNGDRIMVLEDTDKDGRADKSHCFVQEKELECPLGIAVFDNVIVVSNTPDIIVYTDVNRNLVFDPGTDKREVLLTGFEQKQHDHSLHAITAGPDGRWYFTNGNCGGLFTDKSGKTFRIGSSYLNNEYTGMPSDDGHVYVGGFAASMEPDGKLVRILAHNCRNSYEMARNSLGDMFINDNDDPPACRVSPIIEGGSFGFFSRDGKRLWRADKRPGQSIPVAEWRQEDPGSIPAGDVYGGGAPTGLCFYENGALGSRWNGLLLSCETGRNTVFGYLPKPDGAGFKLERFDFITTNKTGVFKGSDFVGGQNNLSAERHVLFRPSDVCVGPDGAVYVCDWFDQRTGGHQDLDETCSGAIYRIAPKGFKPRVPELDLTTVTGQIAALRSPAVNTRWLGASRLRGNREWEEAAQAVLDDDNPYVAARAIWLLPADRLAKLLESKDSRKRLVALRALIATDPEALPPAALHAAEDEVPAIRREAAASLRNLPAVTAMPILAELAARYDGKDRSYLEAFGLGCSRKEAEVWATLRERMGAADPLKWSRAFARITWRLHPNEAVPSLQQRALSKDLPIEERRLALDTLAFIQHASAAHAMMTLAKDPGSDLKSEAMWWLIKRSTEEWSAFDIVGELKKQGIFDPEGTKLISISLPPPAPNDKMPLVADVLKLKGDAKRGSSLATRCVMCHEVNGQGIEYGPALTGWGLSQPSEVIAEALINPGKDIAHGYDGHEIVTKDGATIHGMVLAEGEILIVKSMGGQTQYVPSSRIKSRKKLETSLMLSAPQLGMSAQDIADVVAYLRAGAGAKATARK